MEQAGASRYWCHMCSQTVNPIREIESMKCPICESGFVEETAPAPANESETPLDLGGPDSDRALSLWAPILLGMMASPIRPRRLEPHSHDDDDHAPAPDAEQEMIMRRRRNSAAILQLLHGIRAGMLLEADSQEERERESDRERDGQRMILINPFNQTIIVQGSGSGERGPLGALGDYFIGPGLDLLMQHLAENDPSRYGTPPARKEAVEALQTVKIEEGMQLQCAVCLDEYEVGDEVKEMPCKHKFHSSCIVTWLELHSSCPVCRYQLPADESKLVSSEASRNSSSSSPSSGNGENGRRFSLPLLWPFSALFSPPNSSAGDPSLALPSTDADDN